MQRKWRKAPKWKFTRAENLWWYRSTTPPPFDDTPTADSLAVINMYLYKCSRGRTLPKDFREHLLRWLQDLNRAVKLKSGKTRFWTIPNYAIVNKIEEPHAFMKRFRRMSEIAIEILDRAPSYLNNFARALSDKEIKNIRSEYEGSDVPNVRQIAVKHKIRPARVGQICRDLKLRKLAARFGELPAASDRPFEDESF